MRSWLVFVLFPLVGIALEVEPGQDPWLDRTLRPEWRLANLQDCLEMVGKLGGARVSLSPKAMELATEQRVTVIADRALPVRTLLSMLEATHDIHIFVGAERLSISVRGEERASLRRAVLIPLSEFGLALSDRDLPDFALGDPDVREDPGHLRMITPDEGGYYIQEAIAGTIDLEAKRHEGLTISIMGDHFMLVATPEEEAAIRQALAAHLKQITTFLRWRITSGLSENADIPLGVVPQATVAALVDRLDARQSIPLMHLNWQRCAHGAIAGPGPVKATVPGRSIDMRAGKGVSLLAIDGEFLWRDPAGPDGTAWEWRCAITQALPAGHAVVWVAPHGEQMAVLVIEPLP